MNLREYWTINKFDFDKGQAICYIAKLSFGSLSLIFSLFMKPVLCWRLLEFWAKSSSQVQGRCMRREFESRENASWTSIWNFISSHCQFIVNWNFRCTEGTLLGYSLTVLFFAELHRPRTVDDLWEPHATENNELSGFASSIHGARPRSMGTFPKISLTKKLHFLFGIVELLSYDWINLLLDKFKRDRCKHFPHKHCVLEETSRYNVNLDKFQQIYWILKFYTFAGYYIPSSFFFWRWPQCHVCGGDSLIIFMKILCMNSHTCALPRNSSKKTNFPLNTIGQSAYVWGEVVEETAVMSSTRTQ